MRSGSSHYEPPRAWLGTSLIHGRAAAAKTRRSRRTATPVFRNSRATAYGSPTPDATNGDGVGILGIRTYVLGGLATA